MQALWILYIFIGIGAFLISFYLEFIVFLSITESPEFAFCITAVFECAKVLTVIFHRFVSDNKNYSIPDVIIYLNNFFKCTLVFLSVICSIAIISDRMDRPNMELVKNKDKGVINTAFEENRTILQQQRNNRLEKITSEIKTKYKDRYQRLTNYYEPRIEAEEALRDKEFKRVINGVRKGPNWHEHDRKIRELTERYRFEKYELRKSENDELNTHITNIENKFQARIDEISKQREQAQTALAKKDYLDDERAKNKVIASFLMTLKEGLSMELEYLTFALLLSLLVSTLLECTIYLTFNYVVMFYNNNLRKHSENQELHAEHNVTQEQAMPQDHVKQKDPDIDESQEVYQDTYTDPSELEIFRHFQNNLMQGNGAEESIRDPCQKKEVRNEQ